MNGRRPQTPHQPIPSPPSPRQNPATTYSEYVAFCERAFGGERLELGIPHREMDPSQPVLYENTLGAYEHFFGVSAPVDYWPSLPAVEREAVDGEEGQAADADTSGRRRAFVRISEEKFHFTRDNTAEENRKEL